MPKPALASTACDHPALSYSPSSHATEAGYRWPTAQQKAVRTRSRAQPPSKGFDQEKRTGVNENSDSFPAPLILPGDDLALDPRYPAQSLEAWVREEERREVTPQRRTIYVAAPPDVDSEVDFVRGWASPKQMARRGLNFSLEVSPPRVEDVVGYLEAFYHGMCLKVLPPHILRFASWDSGDPKTVRSRGTSTAPDFVGLNTESESIRIRCRPSRDGVFHQQLNLDDLLDAAISILPEDAYALLLIVNHDLFEDVDDVFVCGRAYGGSGVAVISTARYHPSLDGEQNVDREHAWPASHCETYLQECYRKAETATKPIRKSRKADTGRNVDVIDLTKDEDDISQSAENVLTFSPLRQAISAHVSLPSLTLSPSHATLSGLWLSRVCRTASHELGHCFGIDHCVYYACSMQGSASVVEDARQPPYLCPVDLSKVLRGTGMEVLERYQALLDFCDVHRDVHMFAAFAAWIRGRLLAREV